MHKTKITIICALFLLQGCAGSSLNQQKSPNVTSSPAGATVFANGLEIGKTPLLRDLYDDFPAGWKGATYTAQGVLMMKMEGCKDYTLKINDRILSKPIHAELECNRVSAPEKPTPTMAAQTKTKNSTESATEKRLRELESLYKKGIVTEAEYQNTRARILSEL